MRNTLRYENLRTKHMTVSVALLRHTTTLHLQLQNTGHRKNEDHHTPNTTYEPQKHLLPQPSHNRDTRKTATNASRTDNQRQCELATPCQRGNRRKEVNQTGRAPMVGASDTPVALLRVRLGRMDAGMPKNNAQMCSLASHKRRKFVVPIKNRRLRNKRKRSSQIVTLLKSTQHIPDLYGFAMPSKY